MNKGVFGARPLRDKADHWQVVIVTGGMKLTIVPVADPAHVCPHCGAQQWSHEPRECGQYPRIVCGKCGKAVGWAMRLAAPCQGCGLVVKEWNARADGKVTATCRACGMLESYPD